MAWKRIERVQTPDALFLLGSKTELAPILDYMCALPKKSELYGRLELTRGEDWLTVFGKPIQEDGDIILPRLENSLSLYTFEPDCWLPIGVGLDMPEHVQSDFIQSIKKQHELGATPIIIVPKFKPGNEVTQAANIYQIRERVQLSQIAILSRNESAKEDTK